VPPGAAAYIQQRTAGGQVQRFQQELHFLRRALREHVLIVHFRMIFEKFLPFIGIGHRFTSY
jgi:hypothetical protein